MLDQSTTADWPIFSDGVVTLRPLTAEDALAQLAGEDEAMAQWVSGGRSTLETVRAYINTCRQDWQTAGPKRIFGILDCATGQLVGFIEANLMLLGDPAEVNISYGIYPASRGKGFAGRAIELMAEYLRTATR